MPEPGSEAHREAWLRERRAAVEASYDAEAPTYDASDSPITPTHRAFITRLLEMSPPDGVVLDVPCGTGKYFAMVRESGRRVVGADQSAGMLAQARARGIAERLEKVGLQELPFSGEFDAVMTVDAMENVSPEDWPLVLANLHRAVRTGGYLYFTVEEVDATEVDRAFADMTARSLPAVRGEIVEGDVAGYHYYPGRARVDRWLADEGLTIVDDGYNADSGYGYRHLLVRRV